LSEQPGFVQYAVPLGLASVEDGKVTWTDEGKAWLEDNTSLILSSSLTSSKSTTGQAYTPGRFAQEVLKTEEGRISIAGEMIQAFPDQYSLDNPPTLADMQKYVVRSSVSSPTQQPAASSEAVRITTQQEFDALPSGAIYIDPGDNKQYTKP